MLLPPWLLCCEAYGEHFLSAQSCCELEAHERLGKASTIKCLGVAAHNCMWRESTTRPASDSCRPGSHVHQSFIRPWRLTFFDGLDGAYCVGMSLAPILMFCTSCSSNHCQSGARQPIVHTACTKLLTVW